MGHTDGGEARNFLYNWTVSALVVSVDLEAVAGGGNLLAVWGTTASAGKRIDRMARPFVANTLLGSSPFSTDDPSGVLRYEKLATIFSDDRLWVNSASRVCSRFFAVELAALDGRATKAKDCGGRAPTYDTSNTWRSLVIAGTTDSISAGLHQDEHPPSATEFPFLAAPDPQGVNVRSRHPRCRLPESRRMRYSLAAGSA